MLICRLCLEEENENDEFDLELLAEVKELVERFFNIEIKLNEPNIPHIVCNSCTQTILHFNLFQIKVNRNQEKIFRFQNMVLQKMESISPQPLILKKSKVEVVCEKSNAQKSETSRTTKKSFFYIKNSKRVSVKPIIKVDLKTIIPDCISSEDLYKQYRCQVCGKQMYNKDEYDIHQFYHQSPLKVEHFICELCGKKVEGKASLKAHMRTHIYDPQNCPVCDEKYTNKFKLACHLKRLHVPSISERCPICGRIFNNIKALKTHTDLVHKVLEPVQCMECGRMLANEKSLRKHMYICHNPRSYKYTCATCGHIFKKKDSLKDHAASHTGEFLHSCDFCSKKFQYKTNWHAHRIKMHPKEYYKWKQNKEFEMGITKTFWK